MELLLTFITGVFFLLGFFLNKICKKKDNISVLAISLAFIVLLNLIIFDMIPHLKEHFSYQIILMVILGFAFLKIMDLFIPHHHHDHLEENDDETEHDNHLEHISIITIVVLCVHNMLECMALYNLTSNDEKAGVMMALAIGLHNMPLGFSIASSLRKNKWIYISILTFSGFIGGLLSVLIGAIPHEVEVYILALTLGMLIYLAIFELLKEVYHSLKNKYTFYGIMIGIVIVIISFLV